MVPVTTGSTADFFRSVDRPAADDGVGPDLEDSTEVEVLEENWDAVQVFIRCRQEYVADMAGAFALGFNAREVESACRLAGIAPDRWPEVSTQAQQMGGIAANQLNQRKGK